MASHIIETAVFVLLLPFWLLWAGSGAYLLLLTAAALAARRGGLKTDGTATMRRFCLLIPAHNEALNIGTVAARLHDLDYPASLFTVVVIADNCDDETAALARQNGAEAMERTDTEKRGKGYALEWALQTLLHDPRRFDAFVFLDADSFLSPNFLREMDAHLADGHEAIQGRYDVENVSDTWRTKMMACALALAHYVKPLGRNTLGWSDGLKGNGMCFSRGVMERVPWSGESITEDIEYTLRLVTANVRIVFAPNAVVRAQMPTSGSQAATQRKRWEGGRYGLLKRAVRLFGDGLRTRRMRVVDRAIELLIPPFAEWFALPVAVLVGVLLWRIAVPNSVLSVWMLGMWGGVLIAEVVYLVVGLALAQVPWSIASSLLYAPGYIVWKLGLYLTMLFRRGAGGWQRTERHEI